MEKYLTFTVGTEKLCYNYAKKEKEMKLRYDLTFIGSFQFMSSSLENLVESLKDELDKFKYIKQEFGNNPGMLTQRGTYPYSFMDE